MKYQKEQWLKQPEDIKIKTVQNELELETHNGTTKEDLLMMLRWLFEQFDIMEPEKWIPVTEGLPKMTDKYGCVPFSDKVLVAQGVNDKQITFGWLRGNEWVTADMVPFAKPELITHWMPLPEKPRR